MSIANYCVSLGTLTTIEYQREALENANTNTEVLKIMGTAAKALKGAHNNMDIDKVYDGKQCTICRFLTMVLVFFHYLFLGRRSYG